MPDRRTLRECREIAERIALENGGWLAVSGRLGFARDALRLRFFPGDGGLDLAPDGGLDLARKTLREMEKKFTRRDAAAE